MKRWGCAFLLLTIWLALAAPDRVEAACIFKHTFVSPKPEGLDPTEIRPSNWNDCLKLEGGSNGQFIVVDTSDATYRTGFTTGLTYLSNQLLLPDGSAAFPALAPSSDSDSGMFFRSLGGALSVGLSHNGTERLGIRPIQGIDFSSSHQIRWSTVDNTVGAYSVDLVLLRDAANTLAQRNGTSPQTARWNETFTDSVNYARFFIQTLAGAYKVGTEAAGTGVARNWELVRGGTTTATVTATELLPGFDNARDLGNASFRWRDLYLVTSVQIGTNPAATGAVRIANNTKIMSRDSTNVSDRNLVWLAGTDATGAVYGDFSAASRVRTTLATPASLSNGDWWVDCTGTSPSRVCAIKVQDGGATRTIASVTF